MAKPDRRALAEELLKLNIKHAVTFTRIDELKTDLRKIATDGENFKEEFPGKGVVKVSGEADAKFKGILPVIDPAKYLALPEKDRKALEDAGVISLVPTYGKPYAGRVAVETF